MTQQTVERSTAGAGWVRRHRTGLLIGFALLLGTGLVVARGTQVQFSASLDPGNAGPHGARAVARVLGHQGVDVDVVRDSGSLEHTHLDAETTVVVTSVENLGSTTADRLLSAAGNAALVLVEPPVGTLHLFDLADGTRVHGQDTVHGRCDDDRYDELRIRVDEATAFPDTPGSCFATTGGALLSTPDPRLTVLGAGAVLSNDQITRADNAAVALRLLGEREHLVWYVPDPADVPAEDGVGLGSLLPRWLGPGLWLGAVALVALVGWRGRRLGPLVSEPLPVAVTAVESTVSRGRLYRKANDRAHAAEVLRRATRIRVADHLRLPRGTVADPDALVRHLSAEAGIDPDRGHDLLSPEGRVPRTDKDLTQLASDLAELDREVRRP